MISQNICITKRKFIEITCNKDDNTFDIMLCNIYEILDTVIDGV